MKHLQASGVRFFEKSKVVHGITDEKKVTGVIVENAVREKIFPARKIILATGGFYSGGLTMRDFDQPREPIFDLPVFFPTGAENWSNMQLFSDKPQGFSTTGILINDKLNPIDADGKVLFDNLHVIGANLGGCDKIFERSAGGIAIASAKKVVLFTGCYINDNEPHVGNAFVKVMNANGYEVLIDKQFKCCGSPLVVTGFLDEARQHADNNVTRILYWKQKKHSGRHALHKLFSHAKRRVPRTFR